MSVQTAERKSAAGLPAHEEVYRRLRDLILFGDLAPGQAVTIQGLTAKLGAGTTPVREAIRRMTTEGALVFKDNRRVSVPVLSDANLQELQVARLALEPQLTDWAARHATGPDLEVLQACDDALDTAIDNGDVEGYLRHNHAFHMALYGLARAPILLSVVEGLWLRFGPSMRVVCGRYGTQNLPDLHKELLSACCSKDAEQAAQAVTRDIRQGMDLMRQEFAPADIADDPALVRRSGT